MRTKGICFILTVLVCCLIFAGCGSSASTNSAIDYAKAANWLSVPSQIDPVKDVDVFYVYPTEYFAGTGGPIIGEINDPNMIAGAKTAFQKQATAFASIGNIYAPYYRQADAIYTLGLKTIDDVYGVIGGIPATDVTAAFDYYIKNYNNNRPFILASHSQGSTVVALLLQNYMRNNPLVYQRMIAAYAIGWTFTKEYFSKNSHLRFAQGPDDTGVIISYNTQGPGFTGKNPVVFPGALAINPIIWTRTGDLATVNQSSGSLLLDSSGNVVLPVQKQSGIADARVTHINQTTGTPDPSSDTSVVICSSVDPKKMVGVPGLPEGFYHNYDYPFYYYDIAKNAQNRVNSFLSKRLVSDRLPQGTRGSLKRSSLNIPSYLGTAEAADQPLLLATAQQQVTAALKRLDRGLNKAAGELGKTGLTGEGARQVLSAICKEFSYAVDCATVDTKGRLTTIEPAQYRHFEGEDISTQEQVKLMLKLHKPVLSQVFRSVEGYDAVDAEYPVFNPEGHFIGSVSLMFKPERFLGEIIQPLLKGTKLDIWAMEEGGRILYDSDPAQVGLNILTSDVYKPFKQLVLLAKKIASKPQGHGVYRFKKERLTDPEVDKKAYWISVSLYGVYWRLVGVYLEQDLR